MGAEVALWTPWWPCSRGNKAQACDSLKGAELDGVGFGETKELKDD